MNPTQKLHDFLNGRGINATAAGEEGMERYLEQARSLAKAPGVDLNALDEERKSVFEIAARYHIAGGHLGKLMAMLVEEGANPLLSAAALDKAITNNSARGRVIEAVYRRELTDNPVRSLDGGNLFHALSRERQPASTENQGMRAWIQSMEKAAFLAQNDFPEAPGIAQAWVRQPRDTDQRTPLQAFWAAGGIMGTTAEAPDDDPPEITLVNAWRVTQQLFELGSDLRVLDADGFSALDYMREAIEVVELPVHEAFQDFWRQLEAENDRLTLEGNTQTVTGRSLKPARL